MSKYIFVVGGVMSGVGKGTATASMGKILQDKGFNVTAIKVDPYVNVDAGTMNPVEHGEVFVTDDGDETDQDIGTYERFLDTNIFKENYMTTGRVYKSVIERERNLEYGGRCVEVVPHVPEEIINRIKSAAERANADITLIEVGGTVGEYQNILFLEAARMMHLDNPDDVLFALVSYLPIPDKVGEMKTKPTQYAARTLNSAGINPDIIICRSSKPLDDPRKEKISIFCSVEKEDIISGPDADTVYEVPEIFREQNLAERIIQKFKLESKEGRVKDWSKVLEVIKSPREKVKIGVAGKYFSTGDFVLTDAYISVLEAIKHAAWYHDRHPEIIWMNSEEFEKDPEKLKEISNLDGLIIPGGFGSRGIEGKIASIKYVRENNIPYLGLCYGMQCAVIEYARHVAGLDGAHTTEIESDCEHPVIHIMDEQKEKMEKSDYGGTMRLGAYPCVLHPDAKSREAYGEKEISERHRHRYEFNNAYRDILTEKGLMLAGRSPDRTLVEIVEVPGHPYFVAVQFHPEFKSRPLSPHPLFREFIKATIN
nr:CTP synthase [Candidatus Saccharibacteria bacterium]NIV04109.1 CTP synthase [Calditrichia bacterium]NIS38666.1 CTP synthase [Candidatus Saccharibacteria bacterium]NIV71332.1 CTP synthase [Calditrichia bacterium]NIV97835.1 CTP synthase [Candidatus Saccharibacteria bacterium]